MNKISPGGITALTSSGGKPQVLHSTPSILKTLIGLDASLSYVRDPPSGLISSYAVEVDQFEGLFISFTKEKPNFSSLFKSIKFEVKRLSQSRLTTSRELIKFDSLTRETDGKWSTLTTLKMPWNGTYSCSG